MTFKTNKYTNWYNKIIANAQSENRDKKLSYFERHHIVPKSIGGTNDKHNLVLLTAKEHFICHLLLTKIVYSTHHLYKMICTLMLFKSKHKHKKFFTSRTYEAIRINQAALTRQHFKHSTNTKEKLSRLAIDRNMNGNRNPNYGNKWTEEQKENIRKLNSGRKMTLEAKQAISKRVTDGSLCFDSMSEAALHHNVPVATISYRVKHGVKGWKLSS